MCNALRLIAWEQAACWLCQLTNSMSRDWSPRRLAAQLYAVGLRVCCLLPPHTCCLLRSQWLLTLNRVLHSAEILS